MRKASLLIFLILATAVPCWAAVVRLIEDAPGQYRLEGDQLEGVAAFDLVVNYDARTLQLTTVIQGPLLQSSLFAGNPNQSGKVHIGAASTEGISGSGTLASIGGAVNNGPAKILSVIAKLHDSSGRPLPVSTVFPKSETFEDQTQVEISQIQDPQTPNPTTSISQVRAGQVSTGKSLLYNPWEKAETVTSTPAEKDEPYIEPMVENESRSDRDSRNTSGFNQPYVDKQQVRISSVLTLFESYEGSRTFEKLSSLFDQEEGVFQQKPKILLADGKTSLDLEFFVSDGKAPSIALRNAQLLKSGFVTDGRFRIRCTPKAGALSAKVLILGGEKLIEIPLTIAPRVSLDGLKITDEENLPQVDLDGDGLVTWQDMYILVANLLVQRTQIK